jgi:alkylation response protein AidB-like acyl-CoA dehydrogenase
VSGPVVSPMAVTPAAAADGAEPVSGGGAGMPDEAAFAREALAFLEREADPRPPEALCWGTGSDSVAVFHETTAEEEAAEVAAARAWQARRFAAGFGWITGPPGYGGRGLPIGYDRLYRALEARFAVPDQSPLRIGIGTVAPAVLAHGTEEQRRNVAVAIYRGDVLACQLFSEPEAGSDLAGVRTRAQRDGDEWVLDGQKVWTSNAHLADVGLCLARTDPEAPKHRGLTMFLVPMDTAGVEIRPLRQMTGGASFNEVFLDGVRLPDATRVGDPGLGWSVTVSALTAERGAVGHRSHGQTARALALLRAGAERDGLGGDPLVRQRLADLEVHLRVARYHQQRMQAVPPERLVGPEGAIDKLMVSANLTRLGEAATALLGPRLAADSGEWGTYAWAALVLGAPGMRLGGGTDEVLKTMLAERLLGLPREPA